MREFLATRSRGQWFALAAWVLLIAVVAYVDLKEGKQALALFETTIYCALFGLAMWAGRRKIFG